MPERVTVASVDDLDPGEGTVVEVDETRIALFNVDGEFHAVANECTHRGGPLGRGELDGTTVTCPWHGSAFDVTTGERVDRPMAASGPARRYDVVVDGSEVRIEL